MSSDFERLLREARVGLPGPSDDATERARLLALGAVGRRRPRVRIAALVGAALVLALGLGIGVGALVVPSGTAAQGPSGLGFLPEEGWYVLQAGRDATPERPAIAIASNVPISPEDGSSIVPYSTLLSLPPDGVVIVANFTGRMEAATVHFPRNLARSMFPLREMPLRIRDATPIQYGGQVRPEEPLGQYQLRGEVNDYAVDLHLYFGTTNPSPALRAEAQRQLDRLVVRTSRAERRASTAAPVPSTRDTLSGEAAVTVDHTLLCTVRTHGGIYEVEARAHAGYRVDSRWAKLAYATVTSGGAGGSLSGNQAVSPNALAWMTAGAPNVETTVDSEFWTFPVRASGTMGYNRTRCTPTRKPIPLTRAGLRGGATGPLGEERDCTTPRRVLLRLRARLQSQGSLQKRGDFISTGVPILDAKMSMRTLSGKPLLYAEVFQSGRTPLFSGRSCVRD